MVVLFMLVVGIIMKFKYICMLENIVTRYIKKLLSFLKLVIESFQVIYAQYKY